VNEEQETSKSLMLDRKLLQKYTAAQQDEHEVITTLIETLTKVDDLPNDQIQQVRDALFHTDFPFLLAMVGPFSAGKSSIINALVGEAILDVGPIPTTDHIHILRYGNEKQESRVGETTTVFNPNPLLEGLSFVDTPGLESVFEKHDSITRKFLHRADLVLLVMVSTHVLSSSNLDFLQELKQYGKRVILVINQIDLLEAADREAVKQFALEQSRLHMGMELTIWMVSAKQALEAQRQDPRDEILYDESGFAEIEEYLKESLNDKLRIQQKLETALQIATNVRGSAVKLIADNAQTLTEHKKTLQNIESQIDEATRAQQRNVDEGLAEIKGHWEVTTERGDEAIQELFQFSRAFGQTFVGIFELFGIAALIRRFGKRTRAEAAFDKHEVDKAISKVPESLDRLTARLEGRDLQDLDGLVAYTKQQVDELPDNLRKKMIGTIQTPMNYNRSFMRNVRGKLDDLVTDARRFETTSLDNQLKNMLIALAIWQVTVVAVTAVVTVTSANTFDFGTIIAFLGVVALLILVGMAALPFRGWLLRRAYRQRMTDLQTEFLKLAQDPLTEMVKYGTQLRRDSVEPFTRLITAQNDTNQTLKAELDTAEQAIQRIQRGLANF